LQGQQDSQRVLFDTIDLESLIPDDHLLRHIDARIDFDFIYHDFKTGKRRRRYANQARVSASDPDVSLVRWLQKALL
jgi:hypothetical protein